MSASLAYGKRCGGMSSRSLRPINTDIQCAHLFQTPAHGHLWSLILPAELALLVFSSSLVAHILYSRKIVFPVTSVEHVFDIARILLHGVLLIWVFLRILVWCFLTLDIGVIDVCVLRSNLLLLKPCCFFHLLLQFLIVLACSFVLLALVQVIALHDAQIFQVATIDFGEAILAGFSVARFLRCVISLYYYLLASLFLRALLHLYLIYLLVSQREESSHSFSAFVLSENGRICWLLLGVVAVQALVHFILLCYHWNFFQIEELPWLGDGHVQIRLLHVRFVRCLYCRRYSSFIRARGVLFESFLYQIL